MPPPSPPPTSQKLPPLGAALTGAAANGQSAVRGRKEGRNSTVIIIAAIAIPFPFFLRAINSSDPPWNWGRRARGRSLYPVNGVELFRSMDEFTESFLCQKCSLASIQTRCSGRFCSTFLSVTNKRGGNGDTAALPRLCTIDGFRFEIAQWQSLQKMQSTPRRKTRAKKGRYGCLFYAANNTRLRTEEPRRTCVSRSVGSTFYGNCSCFRDQSAPPFVTREREAVPRPLSFSDRSERPIEGGSTMNSEGAKGQNIFGCERIERKESLQLSRCSPHQDLRQIPNMIS